jgi:hypothetical protein
MPSVTSTNDAPQLFQPLPGRTVDRSAAYESLLRDLLDLVCAEPPAASADEPDARRSWCHRARRAVGAIVSRRAKEASDAGSVPEDWFEPLIRAAVHEPDPSFNRQLVEPAIAAFGRRRVQLALIAYLDTGTAPDIAGAARAWYWTQVPLVYVGGSKNATPESTAEYEAFSDLRKRYRYIALRRFVTEDDLDVRRCILPGIPLYPRAYPADMHDLVARAVQIARTSSDEYLRHRVEIQVGSSR